MTKDKEKIEENILNNGTNGGSSGVGGSNTTT